MNLAASNRPIPALEEGAGTLAGDSDIGVEPADSEYKKFDGFAEVEGFERNWDLRQQRPGKDCD